MSYEKRVCVLKQLKKGFSADGGTLSGAVYAERLGEELTVTPRILGLSPVREGRYALAIWADNTVHVLALSGSESVRVSPGPSVRAGFSALLVFLKTEPEPIAYGCCGAAPSGYETLLSAIRESGVKKKKETEEPVRPFREQKPYDDDAIAGNNYYQRPPHENDEVPAVCGGDETAQADGAQPPEDDDADIVRPQGTLTYYNTVRKELQTALNTLPRDTRLNAVFPCSEWVCADGALLGIIYKEGVPQFLCVAVEASGDPPAGMEKASFVPASAFDDKTGFWVVFQSADSGEYVTVSAS